MDSAAALANGEGIILVPTVTHWNGIRARLEAEGVDVGAARERGQLTVVDADEFLPRFMRNAMPDSSLFFGLAADAIGQARAGGRYSWVRWWGEMVNVLWERGDVAASMDLEDLFDQLAREHDIAIFCSFLMDNFNGEVQARVLPRLGTNHSHLIPVEDYARLERAVGIGRVRPAGQASPALTPARHLQALTYGETRVLRYLPTNLSAREIAGELCLSVNTVKTHQRHLYQKLGARSRTRAVEQARALGLLASFSRRREQHVRESTC